MTTWTAAETALLQTLVRDGLNDQEITQEFQSQGIERSYKSVQRKRQRERKKKPRQWHARVQKSNAESFDRQIQVEADRALLLFDMHAPFHDAAFLNDLIGLAIEKDVELVGVGGDLIDFASLSYFGRQVGIEAAQEIASARQIIETLATEFERIVYTGGNHEARILKKLDYAMELADVLRWFVRSDNVEVSSYHWFELTSNGIHYQVEHPKNVSVIPGRVPQRLAMVYHTNIVAGHGHQWAITRDKSGQYWCVDSGVCADPQKLRYINEIHNTRPRVCQGATMILNGRPTLLHPDLMR